MRTAVPPDGLGQIPPERVDGLGEVNSHAVERLVSRPGQVGVGQFCSAVQGCRKEQILRQ